MRLGMKNCYFFEMALGRNPEENKKVIITKQSKDRGKREDSTEGCLNKQEAVVKNLFRDHSPNPHHSGENSLQAILFNRGGPSKTQDLF